MMGDDTYSYCFAHPHKPGSVTCQPTFYFSSQKQVFIVLLQTVIVSIIQVSLSLSFSLIFFLSLSLSFFLSLIMNDLSANSKQWLNVHVKTSTI